MNKAIPYYETPDGRAKLYLGDAIEVMVSFPDACVDAIVTDPPYGLEFMGKEWDRFAGDWNEGDPAKAGHPTGGLERWTIPRPRYHAGSAYQSWTTAWATEAYRILKPGAYMLVMGGTRTHHRLGCGLEDAGFEIRDELAWIYASGFPKNYDVSKGIDKKAGAEREDLGELPSSRSVIDGGQPFGTFSEKRGSIPATPEAQYWEGYGTALKPAHEPIWLVKKPNEGTYVDNVLKHGCGAMNIDGSRIDYQGESPGTRPDGIKGFDASRKTKEPWQESPSGRWPANVLVDCYPEEFIGGVVIEGEGGKAWAKCSRREKPQLLPGQEGTGGLVGFDYPHDEPLGNGLLGPYTRFFVIPKPSKAEKDKGCEEFYWDKTSGKPVRCSRERWEELGKEEERIKKETGKHKSLRARGNIHVTVKPVRLGKWLIKLISPHQHPVVVLDPFCGSGTFLVSALELNREEGYQIETHGVDKEPNNMVIAKARVEAEGRYLL